MREVIRTSTFLICAVAASLLLTACGGGRTAVIGFGNSGNRIFESDAIVQAIAEALADGETTPMVSDEEIAGIYGAILSDAREGNTEAALIVLLVAEAQRREEE